MVPRTNPGLIGFILPASGLSMPFKKDQSSPFYAHAQEKCKLLENRSNDCSTHAHALQEVAKMQPFVTQRDIRGKRQLLTRVLEAEK